MITALFAALTLQAQAAPACDGGAYDDFDFWLGTWEVTANGQRAGTNVITKEEKGCLLIERWTSASGGTGQSYNYYDPSTEVWRQVWVSQGFTIDYEGGLDEDGQMKLEGLLSPRTGGEARPFRGRWTPNDDGSVQQTFWLQNGETGEWELWFDGHYTKSQ